MALGQITNAGTPLDQRGQGAVETILALPVFLALICIIFQFFLLGIAQIQLQYAAFYAARAGAVNNSDKEIMRQTVSRILSRSPKISLSDSSFRVQVLEPESNPIGVAYPPGNSVLKIRVHWNYPLIVPLADVLLNKKNFTLPGDRPAIWLHASWTLGKNSTVARDESHAAR